MKRLFEQVGIVVCSAVLIAVLAGGCGKFDRSKIALPKMNFITGEDLHSVVCLDTSHTWVFGNYGVIFFSPDGGTTWTKQESGVEVMLGDASFASPEKGWVVGVAGTIIHTADGGKAWKPQNSSTGKDLLDVYFLDAMNGWAVGELGTIIGTKDGGNTWQLLREEEDKHFNNVFFVDKDTGWVAGEFGMILHTEDGGATWNIQECTEIKPDVGVEGWEKPMPALYGIYFLDKRVGWIVGMDGVIIKTVDGGESWKKLPSGSDKPLYNIVVNGERAWIVGNKGTYLMSQDGGNTWTPKDEAIKSKYWLRQITFCDKNNGFVVGAIGLVAKTTDGGQSWKIISGLSYEMEEFGLTDF